MPTRESQQTHTQHPVPQNIMDVEFKLIGDLTMRQFVYLVVFGGAAYLVSISFTGIFKWPLIIFFILVGIALAFYTIQERGMDEWIINFVRAMYSPTQRLWRKEIVLPAAFTYQSLAVVRQELITLAPTSSRRKLEEYLELQGQGQVEDPLDIPEKEFLMKVKAAFVPSTATPPIDVRSFPLDQLQTAPVETSEEFKPFVPTTQEEPQAVLESTKAQSTTTGGAEEQVKEITTKNVPETIDNQTISVLSQPQVQKPAPVVVRRPTKPTQRAVKRTYPQSPFASSPSTPDRHVGRRFTSLLPSEGRLILPVRGEMVIQTSEELDIEKDIMERTDQLRRLLEQIRGDDQFKGIVAAGVDIPQDDLSKQKISEAQDVVQKVKEENEILSEEIQKLKAETQASQEDAEQKLQKEAMIKKLEEEKNQTSSDYADLQKQVLELQRRLKEKEDAAKQGQGPQKVGTTYASMQPLTKEPNILSGVLKNPKTEPISGSVLLIKNHKGEAVRAVKTNSIGQFAISTPLSNGVYTIEVGTGTEGLTFDIITVEVKGEVIPPVEILGRSA